MKALQLSVILLVALLFMGTISSAPAKEAYSDASDYLCEYGIQRYKEGDIADAIHELKKCLMVNPNHKRAREFLNMLLEKKKPAPKKKLAPKKVVKTPPRVITVKPKIVPKKVVPPKKIVYRPVKPMVKPKMIVKPPVPAPPPSEKIIKPCPTLAKDKEVRICLMPSENYRVKFDFIESDVTHPKGLKYVWDFGDGTATQGRTVHHVYQKGGTYNAKLIIDDGKGLSCSVSTRPVKVILNRPPVAKSGPNLVCCVSTQSKFDGSSSYDPDKNNLAYIWDFGDGTAAEGAKAKHQYAKPGEYKVSLTVKDDSGLPCGISTDSFTVSVSDRPVSVIKVKEGKGQEES